MASTANRLHKIVFLENVLLLEEQAGQSNLERPFLGTNVIWQSLQVIVVEKEPVDAGFFLSSSGNGDEKYSLNDFFLSLDRFKYSLLPLSSPFFGILLSRASLRASSLVGIYLSSIIRS